MEKWEVIKLISKASTSYGDKLLELMEKYKVTNLQEITEEQANEFLDGLICVNKTSTNQ